MKLISCHIENYGVISDRDVHFEPGLTALCESNGFGKTTLASFLRAMFYGLDSDRANGEFNERRHFCPFGGGIFGGNLTFEAEGNVYKIERTFDVKSETKDALTLYCNGREMSCDGRSPGQMFFGIDKQSFERTAFVDGADVEILSTGSINSKLNALATGADDSDYERAVAKLDAKCREYKKLKGEGGIIHEDNRRISELRARIVNKQTIEQHLPGKYSRLAQLRQQSAELNAELAAARSQNELLARWEGYDMVVADTESKRQHLRQISENYPFGMPSRKELDTVAGALESAKLTRTRLEQSTFTAQDGANYSELCSRFERGVPTEEQLGLLQKDIEEEQRCAYRLQQMTSDATTEEQKELLQRFRFRRPSEQELAKVQALAEDYRNAQALADSLPDTISTAPTQRKPRFNKGLFVALAALFAVVAIAGVALVFSHLAVGVSMIAVGVVALAATGFVYLNKRVSADAKQPVVQENPQKRLAKQQASELYDQLRACLSPFGYTLENGVPFAVAQLVRDVQRHAELSASMERNAAEIRGMQAHLGELRGRLDVTFNGYGIGGGNHITRLASLRESINKLRQLQLRKEEWEQTSRNLHTLLHGATAAIDEFCRKYHVRLDEPGTSLAAIQGDVAQCAHLQEEITLGAARAESIRQEKALVERPSGTRVDVSAREEALNALQEQIAGALREIEEDERAVEQLQELQNELDSANAALKKHKADFELLQNALNSLRQADRALKDKYVKPVRDRFLDYSAALEKALGERIVMTPDFRIRYERNGIERSDKHLSAGQRSLCALCFRLALIDNMYSAEKPFVVLDDPFVHLDAEHLARALNLLRDLSQRVQVVYFTCHSSRLGGV